MLQYIIYIGKSREKRILRNRGVARETSQCISFCSKSLKKIRKEKQRYKETEGSQERPHNVYPFAVKEKRIWKDRGIVCWYPEDAYQETDLEKWDIKRKKEISWDLKRQRNRKTGLTLCTLLQKRKDSKQPRESKRDLRMYKVFWQNKPDSLLGSFVRHEESPATPCVMMCGDDCNTLQHTATYCNILHHTEALYNTLIYTRICSALQHTATHCNILQHTATYCNTLQHFNL